MENKSNFVNHAQFIKYFYKAANAYKKFLGFSFDVPNLVFERTPEKNYSAKSVVPVKYLGQNVGNMVVISFQSRDGTGDESLYKIGQLVIPERLKHANHSEKVFPRTKEGIIYELFFPLFSVYENKINLFATSLEEITVDCVEKPKAVKKAWDLGLNSIDYVKRVKYEDKDIAQKCIAKIYLTVGYRGEGQRFGDPHAIYNPIPMNALQVAGFLTVKNSSNPLLKMINSCVFPPV